MLVRVLAFSHKFVSILNRKNNKICLSTVILFRYIPAGLLFYQSRLESEVQASPLVGIIMGTIRVPIEKKKLFLLSIHLFFSSRISSVVYCWISFHRSSINFFSFRDAANEKEHGVFRAKESNGQKLHRRSIKSKLFRPFLLTKSKMCFEKTLIFCWTWWRIMRTPRYFTYFLLIKRNY